MFKRLYSAKPTYRTVEDLNSYKKKIYIENLISSNNNRINPNLNFETPNNFRKKLDKFLREKGMSERASGGKDMIQNENEREAKIIREEINKQKLPYFTSNNFFIKDKKEIDKKNLNPRAQSSRGVKIKINIQ